MTKFNVKDKIINPNNTQWKVIFITNRSYKIELLYPYMAYAYGGVTERILSHEYVEKNFVKVDSDETFDKYSNVIKRTKNAGSYWIF